jgi:hypothetical protein
MLNSAYCFFVGLSTIIFISIVFLWVLWGNFEKYYFYSLVFLWVLGGVF